jgi:hypothetical protein
MSTTDRRVARSGRPRGTVVRRCLELSTVAARPRVTYESWASATGPRARVAFWRYIAALDAEERASEVYAGLVRRVGQVTANDADLSGPLAA